MNASNSPKSTSASWKMRLRHRDVHGVPAHLAFTRPPNAAPSIPRPARHVHRVAAPQILRAVCCCLRCTVRSVSKISRTIASTAPVTGRTRWATFVCRRVLHRRSPHAPCADAPIPIGQPRIDTPARESRRISSNRSTLDLSFTNTFRHVLRDTSNVRTSRSKGGAKSHQGPNQASVSNHTGRCGVALLGNKTFADTSTSSPWGPA